MLSRGACVPATAGTSEGGGRASTSSAVYSPRANASFAGIPGTDDPCRTGRPTGDIDGHVIIGTERNDILVGTPHRDLIYAGPGNDVIFGGGGADIICAGGGDDIVHGDRKSPRERGDTRLDGNDYIDAGPGRDTVYGNGGDDIIHGGTGGDELHGNEGDDRIFGDLLDDYLYGEEGDDLLVGGHGIDRMYGNEGDDWLRGDTNRDVMHGGAGTDTVSFMTATPPGQVLNQAYLNDFLIGNEHLEMTGVMPGTVDAEGHTVAHPDWGREIHFTPSFAVPLSAPGVGSARGVVVVNRPRVDAVGGVTHENTAFGVAVGDGGPEELRGVEIVYGSPFDDHILVGPETLVVFAEQGDDLIETAGPTLVHGGGGADTCQATTCEGCAPTPCVVIPSDAPPRDGSVYVYLTSSVRDLGLIVLGGPNGDDLSIAMAQGDITVTANDGAPITAGPGCVAGDRVSEVRCGLAEAELRFITAFGDGGNDHIALVGGGFPRDMTATIDGGTGDDVLEGHGGADILFPGPDGVDSLFGNAGDDALISVGDGADTMYGGPGNDQLVSNDPCGGHSFYGGPGWDVGGFARVGTSFSGVVDQCRERIHARIGGQAYQPFYCTPSRGTYLSDSIEVLEGAGGSDVLIGNGQDNTLWGWGGDDILRGQGGDDVMEGHAGDDWIFGSRGRDHLRGGSGFDHLMAAETTRERDPELSCGAGGGRIESSDMTDPNANGCGEPSGDAGAWRDICCLPPHPDRMDHQTEWDRVCAASSDEGDRLAD
ncbi:MAG: hypothetical protein H6719_25215 [Sandaracinaceae bacterium]|nr:hypothetical protein [Sandaracinaceae bacterium]